MGDLHLVLPAKSLSNLDAVIVIMVTRRIDDVLLKHGGQLHVLPLPVHLKKVEGIIHSLHRDFLTPRAFLCGTPPSCLKVING